MTSEEFIRKTVAEAPDPSPEQLRVLSRVLLPPGWSYVLPQDRIAA